MKEIRELILSFKSPVVFHGAIKEWEMIKWSDDEWCTLFGDEPLPFRCGQKKCSAVPQWERSCKTEYMVMREFFRDVKESNLDTWKYFDYKYLNQWLTTTDAFNTMSWAKFGFPEITKDECTLWIGSAGAHTPCHMDSYGCNLVAQIQGHKQWILFPPSESAKLKMTRVPYEESSVYSALNFNAPIDSCEGLDNAYIVTLSPGDVLFVPFHWWHYVENLDTAISINTWVPLIEDDNCRMDEVLVRFFLSQVSSNLLPEQLPNILNPNEDDVSRIELPTILNQIKICLDNVLIVSNKSEDLRPDSVNKTSISKCNMNEGILELPQVDNDLDESRKRRKILPADFQELPNCSSALKNYPLEFKMLANCKPSELKNILDSKCKCGSKEEHTGVMKSNLKLDETVNLLPALINAFSHPDVLDIVKKQLLEQVTCKKIL